MHFDQLLRIDEVLTWALSASQICEWFPSWSSYTGSARQLLFSWRQCPVSTQWAYLGWLLLTVHPSSSSSDGAASDCPLSHNDRLAILSTGLALASATTLILTPSPVQQLCCWLSCRPTKLVQSWATAALLTDNNSVRERWTRHNWWAVDNMRTSAVKPQRLWCCLDHVLFGGPMFTPLKHLASEHKPLPIRNNAQTSRPVFQLGTQQGAGKVSAKYKLPTN